MNTNDTIENFQDIALKVHRSAIKKLIKGYSKKSIMPINAELAIGMAIRDSLKSFEPVNTNYDYSNSNQMSFV